MKRPNFIGYIDEVRIWNISRNNPDIAANMNNLSNPTSQTGLLGYYQFNGNYNNLQGNTSYNGIGVGGLLQNISNPLFNGSVSLNFCSLQEIFENNLNSKIRIYPNPSDGNISIDFENYIIDNSTLIVTNLVGQTLKTIKISNKTTEISIHEPDGIYFFTIESNAGNHSTKLIIKNDN